MLPPMLPLLLALPALAACPAEDVWPSSTWAPGPVPDAAAVAALEAYLFPQRDDEARTGVRTDGIVIVQSGHLVYERYGADWTPEMPHLLWSASKSFTNALIGIAQREGRLDIHDSICDHVEATNPDLCAATVRDFLEFSSGIAWRETYENEPPTASSVLAMLWGEGRGDAAELVLRHGLRDAPGTSWEYSSGDTNVLSKIAGKALAPEHGDHFPWAVLFDPIGIQTATWERDAAGTYIGSSYLYMPPRDMARFGYLLLQDGCWQGERILPEGWVAASTEVSAPIRNKALSRSPGDTQGRQFWLNQPVLELGDTQPPWPHVPTSAYAAMGHWKQSIWVLPEQDLVIAYTADNRDGSFSYDTMIPLAMAVAASAQPPPPPAPDPDPTPAVPSPEEAP